MANAFDALLAYFFDGLAELRWKRCSNSAIPATMVC
jgi:hypothetical protein